MPTGAPDVPPPVRATGRADETVPPVLAEVVRSGFVEGRHRGALVVLAADGQVECSLGNVTSPVYPRSSNKPAQAAAVLRAGVELSGARLAVAAGSHAGESFHVALVEQMLAERGLSAAALRCPPDLPLDPEASEAHLASGGTRTPLAMNCSGKHAAMLAACQLNGWPMETYLEPTHPLQTLVTRTLTDLSGEEPAHTGTDGCGAPLLALSLTAVARMFRALVVAPAGSPEAQVAEAMRSHPEYVGGTRRHDTWLMRDVPGVVAKTGAEAVQGLALPDGRALALKIEDGSTRALGPVLARLLDGLGVTGPILDRLAAAPLLGGGRPVGQIRAAF